MESILQQIRTQLEEELDVSLEEEGLDNESNLWNAGILDSFAIVDMIVFAEETFGVKFAPRDMLSEQIASVSGLAAMITEKQSA